VVAQADACRLEPSNCALAPTLCRFGLFISLHDPTTQKDKSPRCKQTLLHPLQRLTTASHVESPQPWPTSISPNIAAPPSRRRAPSSRTSSAAAAKSSKLRSAGQSARRTSPSAVASLAETSPAPRWVLRLTATTRAATSRARFVYPTISCCPRSGVPHRVPC
jgi:hypothetical protein